MNSTVTISKKTVANHLKRIERREYKRIEKPYMAHEIRLGGSYVRNYLLIYLHAGHV